MITGAIISFYFYYPSVDIMSLSSPGDSQSLFERVENLLSSSCLTPLYCCLAFFLRGAGAFKGIAVRLDAFPLRVGEGVFP